MGIMINGVEWILFLVDPFDRHLYRADGSLTIGMCDNNYHQIYIRNDLYDDKFWLVLVHELTHASLFSYGIDLSRCCHEELIADYVATHGEEIIAIAKDVYEKIKGRM